MANNFGADILLQAEDPEKAAAFYTTQLGLEITDSRPDLISLRGPRLNLFIERGQKLGPVLEIFVADVEAAKQQLTRNGCEIVKDEPEYPRCYVRDPFGLIYNLARR
jgi:predicted enzyme related to lactoylglutathione lyase